MKTQRRERGQSLIEFIIVSMAYFTFFFIIIRMSFNFAVGHYIHYATFMSARALFAADAKEQIQIQNAATMLQAYLGGEGNRYGIQPGDAGNGGGPQGSTIGKGPEYKAPPEDWFWQEGVTFSFKQKFYVFPLISMPSRRANQTEFVSESWLGREVSFDECHVKLQQGSSISGRQRIWYYDNGC